MEALIRSIEIFGGPVIGVLTYVLSRSGNNVTALFSIMIGLLSTLVIIFIVESLRLPKIIRETYFHLVELLVKIVEKQQDISDIVQILRHGTTTVSREQLPDFWIALLWHFKEKFWATSYISPDEGWDQAYTALGLEIQRTKIKVNKADIRRVFIIDDEEEKINCGKLCINKRRRGSKSSTFLGEQ